MHDTTFKRKLLALALASALGIGTAAAQAPDSRGRQRASPSQGHDAGRPSGGQEHGARHGQDAPHPSAQSDRQPAGPDGHSRGVGPDRQFRQGDQLPPSYRFQRYVVEDWRGRGLGEPPRGHEWVRVGTDYALIAITTGLIVRILLGD